MSAFKQFSSSPNSPAVDYFTITPADAPLPQPIRGFYVGGAGNVSLTNQDGDVVIFIGVQAGAFYPFAALRVNLTGTTATNLVGLV